MFHCMLAVQSVRESMKDSRNVGMVPLYLVSSNQSVSIVGKVGISNDGIVLRGLFSQS